MTSIMNTRRCGGCHFAKLIAQDLTKRICWGAPPSAAQFPLPNGKMTLQMARPVVSVSDDACALWQPKDDAQMQRDQDDIRMMQATDVSLAGFKQ